MDVRWRVRWGEESRMCKAKERRELGLFREWQLTQYDWKMKRVRKTAGRCGKKSR